MRISEKNWMQVEEFLKADDRCVLPLGCTEQHAYLSLSTDSILAERISIEAAQPLGIPVFPVLAYGITPSFRRYPGTISLRVATYVAILKDVLDGLKEQGFRRVLLVNGHGGNIPGASVVQEWLADSGEGMEVRWHNWWNAPATMAKVQEIDPVASHASWMENFPWTRLSGVDAPDEQKTAPDYMAARWQGPERVREVLGDGNFAGRYQRSDEDMRAIWEVGVQETRSQLWV